MGPPGLPEDHLQAEPVARAFHLRDCRAPRCAPHGDEDVKRLADEGYLRHTPYQGVALTKAGEQVALRTIRHHRLLELYLARALGYPWDLVDAEAERLEHVISEEMEARIDAVLGYPTVDPHGHAIPCREGTLVVEECSSLAEAEPGMRVRVCQVDDASPEVLRHLGWPLSGAADNTSASFGGHLRIEVQGRGAPWDGTRRTSLSPRNVSSPTVLCERHSPGEHAGRPMPATLAPGTGVATIPHQNTSDRTRYQRPPARKSPRGEFAESAAAEAPFGAELARFPRTGRVPGGCAAPRWKRRRGKHCAGYGPTVTSKRGEPIRPCWRPGAVCHDGNAQKARRR